MPGGAVFLTGATGFVGGRLLSSLLEDGVPVRALTRDAARLERVPVEVVEGDLLDTGLLERGLAGISAAYYLVHSLGREDFGSADRLAAQSFAAAASSAGVGRIVYLGGLGRGELSPHLTSRQEVGRILREAGVPSVELQASVVIGEGSVSYEAFRTLAQLPLTVLPDWVDTPSQPIAVDDVIAYLREAADVELAGGTVFEIGGADVVPYRWILEAVGGSAVTVPAPGAAATLVSRLKAIQPERVRVVSDLLDSLRVDTSVHDDRALRAFSMRPRGLRAAIDAAG